jgi:hypothetical protein
VPQVSPINTEAVAKSGLPLCCKFNYILAAS